MSFCPMGSNYGSYILVVVLETRLNRIFYYNNTLDNIIYIKGQPGFN